VTSSPAISFYTTVLRPAQDLANTHAALAAAAGKFPFEHVVSIAEKFETATEFITGRPRNLKLISAPKSSISEGFNIAIRACSAPLIMVANAGDRIIDAAPLIKALHSQPEADFAYGDISLNGKRVRGRPVPLSCRSLYLHGMGFCHGACATRRDFHDRYGYYDPAFRISMDFAVFMGAVVHGAVMMKVPDLISEIEAPGNSSQRLNRALENYRVIRRHLPSLVALPIAAKWLLASWLMEPARG
jgi:hypothetical protein